MQRVSEIWYKLYIRFSAVGALLLVAACIAAMTMPNLRFLQTEWGLTIITLVLGLTQLFYFLIYKSQEVRRGQYIATLLAVMLQVLTLINLIHGSGRLHSWYLVVWFILVLAMGMFGTYAAASTGFLALVYFVSELTDKLTSSEPLGLLHGSYIVGGTFIAAGLSSLIWRRMYVDQESQAVKNLSGQLKNSQQQAEIMVQSIKDGTIVTDNEGKITLFNPAAEQMTGWPIAEALGIDVALVVKFQQENGKELEDTENPLKIVAQSGQASEAMLRLVKRDNSFTTVSVVITPVVVQKGQAAGGMAMVFRDVSEARADEHRRAEFVSTASHEMRTPVAAIEGYLQLALNDKVSKVDAKARSFLEKALDSTHHLGQLFQDLLTSAKAEDGRIISHPSAVEMGEFSKELAEGLRFAAEKKGLLLEYKIGASSQEKATGGDRVLRPLYYVNVDPDRLREVITNLFDNAVKYTDKGKVVIGLTGNMEVVQLFVKDTGPGIPKEDVPHLFQKFYRVDNSATRTIGGTGLGLFICKQIIDLYKGRIWVESEQGQGSTFYINLPRLSTQKAQELLQQTEQGTV